MQDANSCNVAEYGLRQGGDVCLVYVNASFPTSCSCSSSFLRLSCSFSSSAYLCFSAWFSSNTTKPHSAARIFSRLASASSCASLSTSARYCSTVSPHPPSAAILPVGQSVGRCGCGPTPPTPPRCCFLSLHRLMTKQRRRAEAERCSVSAPAMLSTEREAPGGSCYMEGRHAGEKYHGTGTTS